MADLIWLHEGALRRTHPVFAAATGSAGAVFIWDDERLTASQVGMKRRLFIYETLAVLAGEVRLAIHAGKAESLLPRLAEQRGVSRILMPASPDPAMLASFGAVRLAAPGLDFEMIEDTPFVTLANPPDLGRFFRYWNKAKKGAMRPHGG